MDSNHIRCFLSLTHTLSFTETALLLHLSQSTCSRYLSSLEQELGVTLFRRDNRTMELTADGRRFRKEAEKLLDQMEHIRSIFHQTGAQPTDSLKIGILSDTSNMQAIRLINHFQTENPGVKLIFQEYSHFALNEALRKELVDVAITASLSSTVLAEMNHKGLGISRNVAVVWEDHPLASRESISVGDLRNEQFVTKDSRESTISYHILMQLCMRHGFTPRISTYAKQISGVLFSISCQLGVSILPAVIVEAFRFPLKCIPLEHDDFHMQRLVMWSPGNHNRALKRFLDSIALDNEEFKK